MYLWLKLWFYGCNHQWVFLTKYHLYENNKDKRPLYTVSVHRCSKCMKIKKDKV